ncbi:MAG: ribosomal RNA small subunit methyltransferase A [SAR86 cluster bacterium]|uniref:Ribosomal RNA small subunit methyltransferase A n=1 Tax=SAR86 cluster bacterium TaxID=2030880 RepID=A0A520MT40_9GAMM|nr:MAG: ribosomal RNA small subunit methyltransferase A [SAR86 cluster bacterium]
MKLKKSLGQNFLKDIFYLDKIITTSQINKTKNVVEIGPGDGALTELILQNSKHLKAFELDNRFCEFLKKKYISSDFEVFNKNFLDVDLRDIFINENIIMGNLPYNVSSQIIIKIIESNLNYQHCIFLIQKELANRFIKSSKSSKLSIQSQFFCDVEPLFDIPPEAFDPAPKVNSTVIKITPHKQYKQYIPSYSNFKKVLTICFANPRKKISTALKNLSVDSSKFNFDLNSRAEELEINDYFEILMQYESQI